MVQAGLDALWAPQGGGDLRTRPQRFHYVLEEAMRRLLASDLLPQRAGQTAEALVHVSADLCALDTDSPLQDKRAARIGSALPSRQEPFRGLPQEPKAT